MIHATRVDEQAALVLVRDARIAAIRWDIIEWGLVLDIDTPATEAPGAPMRRAWLVFSGVSDVTVPARAARLPNGIWVTSVMNAESGTDGFRTYSAAALLPVFDENVPRGDGLSATVVIRAQGLLGVVSSRTAVAGDHGLSFEARTGLSTDMDMASTL
jgi:hypothetical protein